MGKKKWRIPLRKNHIRRVGAKGSLEVGSFYLTGKKPKTTTGRGKEDVGVGGLFAVRRGAVGRGNPNKKRGPYRGKGRDEAVNGLKGKRNQNFLRSKFKGTTDCEQFKIGRETCRNKRH